jgi:hypothetical protein
MNLVSGSVFHRTINRTINRTQKQNENIQNNFEIYQIEMFDQNKTSNIFSQFKTISIPPFRYTQYMILDGLEGDHELVFYKHVIMILLPNFGLYRVSISIRIDQRPRISTND